MTVTQHIPVMLETILRWLVPQSGKVIVDGTLGGGGHAVRLAASVTPNGKILALDRDPNAVARTRTALSEHLPIQYFIASYDELPEILVSTGQSGVDGILLDLGLSSDQLADGTRGFSFTAEGPLDLRFNEQQGEPAWKWLQYANEKEIADTIYRYGEERLSRRIARRIVEARQIHPIRTALQLAELVRGCVPRSKNHRIDPATRTFQALRIFVNDELTILERALQRLPDCLNPGGRIAILSFHSLEDRLVKNAFREDPRLDVLTRKPEGPTETEFLENSRSRSAKLRVAECRAFVPTT